MALAGAGMKRGEHGYEPSSGLNSRDGQSRGYGAARGQGEDGQSGGASGSGSSGYGAGSGTDAGAGGYGQMQPAVKITKLRA